MGLDVSTLQDLPTTAGKPSKNLSTGHPPVSSIFLDITPGRTVRLHTELKKFEDFDVAFFAEDVYGDAGRVAVDDYVAFGTGDP
jgi:hypothetical protein